MQYFGIYEITSFIKIIFGIALLLIDFLLISVNEDKAIAFTLLLIGFFLLSWGISYFFFLRGQQLFSAKVVLDRIRKNAYKSSFLFGLYAISNILLFLSEMRNKGRGIFLLILFIIMQCFIFMDIRKTTPHDYT